MSDPIVTLEERLHAHPVLKKRVEALLQIIEAPSQEIATADEAELRVIEELRRFGNDLLQEWASTKEREHVEDLGRSERAVVSHGKKTVLVYHLWPNNSV